MTNHRFLSCVLHAAAIFSIQTTAFAVDYYKNDFESGAMPVVGTPQDVWMLNPNFADYYGSGNHFLITDSTAHSGNYSLKIAYEGRNSACNTCGAENFAHKKGLDNVDYFVADDGDDLTIADNPGTNKPNDGPNAQPGRLVYNNDNGYSVWEITAVENDSATNDKLALKLLKPGINGETPEFNSDDHVSIKKECGIDGTVGNDIDRRSDCNVIVQWFQGVEEQTPGTSIHRRMYLKQEITTPFPHHQKLHYVRPNSKGTRGSVKGELLLMALNENSLQSSGPPFPQTGLRHYGGDIRYRPGQGLPTNLRFERGVWYYIEVGIKSSTFNTSTGEYNKDGEYRLWIAKSGEESTTPILEVTGLQLPALDAGGNSISLWGNHQHWQYDTGAWYMDDLLISDAYIGFSDVARNGNNTPPPKAPESQ